MNRPRALGGKTASNGGKVNTPDYYHYYYSQPLDGPARTFTPQSSSSSSPSPSPPPPPPPTRSFNIDVKAIAFEILDYLKYIVKQPIFYKIVAWLLTFWFFIKIEFGAVFVVLSGFGFIYTHLGERKKGEQSAYNVFNKGHKELLGTLNAKQFENELMMRG